MSDGARSRGAFQELLDTASAGVDPYPPTAVAAVPVLEDLPALLGLVPTVVRPAGDEAEASDGGSDAAEARPRGRKDVDAEPRTRPFSVRLSPGERALVHRAALLRAEGVSVAGWARQVLVERATELLAEEEGG